MSVLISSPTQHKTADHISPRALPSLKESPLPDNTRFHIQFTMRLSATLISASALISGSHAADCYGKTGNMNYMTAIFTAWDQLEGRFTGTDAAMSCVVGKHAGYECLACFERAQGANPTFGLYSEASRNVQKQCIPGDGPYKEGYWESQGLRVCHDCSNSGNCKRF